MTATYETKMDPLATAFDPIIPAPIPVEPPAVEPTEPDAVAELTDQVARMRRWMDAHTVAAARPVLGGGDPAATEAKSLFVERYLRRGDRHGFRGQVAVAGRRLDRRLCPSRVRSTGRSRAR